MNVNQLPPPPKDLLQEVLYGLIAFGKISFHNFSMQDFRKRISILKNDYGLKLDVVYSSGKTKYGNCYAYCIHSLCENELDNALLLYNKLQNK